MSGIKKTSGFTLAETVIALAVLLVTTIIIQMLVQTRSHIRPLLITSTTNWYLFVAELESPKHQFELHDGPGQQLVLLDRSNHKEYWLRENQTVYLRGKKGGYLPLLTDYVPHSLEIHRLDKRRVEISAQTRDGKVHYSTLCFLQERG